MDTTITTDTHACIPVRSYEGAALWALLIEVFALIECFVMTKPSMALSLVAFVEVVERIS